MHQTRSTYNELGLGALLLLFKLLLLAALRLNSPALPIVNVEYSSAAPSTRDSALALLGFASLIAPPRDSVAVAGRTDRDTLADGCLVADPKGSGVVSKI